jgi:hypothetical protein
MSYQKYVFLSPEKIIFRNEFLNWNDNINYNDIMSYKWQMNYEKFYPRWVPVAHTYNPSYVGGWDQEDHGSKPAWVKCLWDSCIKQ